MLSSAFEKIHFSFDELHYLWECKRTQNVVNALILLLFLLLLCLIELKRNSLLPQGSFPKLSTNPFYAVYLAFSMLLVVEVLNLIFILPASVSRSVGKQLEILTLYFLRHAFKQLINFTEPIVLAGHMESLLRIGTYGLGALFIFVCVNFYYRQQFSREEPQSGVRIFYFVGAKKAVGLILFAVFLILGGYNLYALFGAPEGVEFFAEFYTFLVFGDILLVLISHPFFPDYHDIFRGSGYAIATLLMRLSMTASPFFDVLIGASAGIYALLLAFAYRKIVQTQK